MPTLVLDPAPAQLSEMLEHRRRSGLDRSDEVWEGVYHMVPAPSHVHAVVEWQLATVLSPLACAAGLEAGGQFNLGESEHDCRVPDGGLHRPGPGGVWHATAALVVEVVSPGDKSWEKLGFYAKHGVDEVLMVDPTERTITWLALRDGNYRPVRRSGLINLGPADLAVKLDWL